MNINCISGLIYEVIKLNPNDELIISKNKFYESEIIKEIFKKFKYNNIAKNKLYIFVTSILKLQNDVFNERIKLLNEKDLDNIIFINLKKITKENVEKFGNIFVNFINYKINYNEFKKLIKIVSNVNLNINFGRHKVGETEYLNEELGKEFYKYNLCDKIEYAHISMKYRLNDLGKKFIKNIYVDSTIKEINYYEKIVDYNFMEKYLPVWEHKAYFDSIINKMCSVDRCVQLGRLHKGKFKKFFEEYSPLITFVMLKYGKETKMRFCGLETKKPIKCDGKVLINNQEEKIEITNNFFDKKDVIRMNDLNQFGYTLVESFDYNKIESMITRPILKAIENKSQKKSYDNSVTLVVVLNNFYAMPSEKIADLEYLKKLFATLYERNYIFGNVYILVEEYNGHEIKIPPRLIKIK